MSSADPKQTVSRAEAHRGAIRLAIFDDHEVLLDSLTSWIGANAPDFDVVLKVQTWRELVHSPNFPTDLVLLDFQLVESVSIEARVRTCRAAGAKVIILSSLDTRDARSRALSAGASDFLTKSMPMHEVMDVARGVMGIDIEDVERQVTQSLPDGSAVFHSPKLSHGEEEALKHYVSGLSTSEVAEKMNVQYETAKTYLRRVREKYVKVGRPASKKADLIVRAAEDGYLV